MKTILIVDDDGGTLDMLRSLLGRAGYRVITAGDGRSALALVAGGECIDLVITDYHMPVLNGIELLAALKEVSPAIPVIMISQYARADLYVKALLLGVAEFLEKASIPQMLLRAVEMTLRKTGEAGACMGRSLEG